MSSLFDIVPYNYFQIFNTKSRIAYSEILFLLFSKCEQENSYTFNKEDFISIIENYFIDKEQIELDEEENQANTSREKANVVFRNLKKCGWIDTEFIQNGEQIVNFEDYAISFLSIYFHFDSNSDIELSSYVYRIYKNLINIDTNRIYFILRDTLDQANSLLRKLKSLNSNIKKYIKRIVDFNGTEEEQLNLILTQLLDDYKLKVIDNAYYYMKTNDNPNKYKNKFKKECEIIKNNLSSVVINQIIKEENIDTEDAKIKCENILEDLYYIFDKIIEIVSEIDIKNTKYINVAIERIRILMNHDVNIEGQVLSILKNFNLLEERDIYFNFCDNKNITSTSLFTPRTVINVKHSPVVNNVKLDDFLFKEQIAQMEYSKQFSQESIRDYVTNLLEKKQKLLIDDFDLKNNVVFAKLILIFVYSDTNKDCYKVIWENNIKNVDNIQINDFRIERS